MEHFTKRLSDFTAGTNFRDLPDTVVHETKRILLDSIGCAIGATAVRRGKIAIRMAQELGGQSEATVLGTRHKVSAVAAAYANGELINTLDYDAILSPGHVSPYVIPSPLAVAERQGASGKVLITAVALAHEVGARVGVSLASLRGKDGLPSRAVGFGGSALGAAAGVSKVLGFNSHKTAGMFGIAAVLSPVPSLTKWAHTAKRSNLKYAPAGCIAQTGVMAGLLTLNGILGDTSILDGEYGFWAMCGTEQTSYHPERILDGLGQEWLLLSTEYKKWPCIRPFNASLDAFDRIIEEHDITPEEIDRVVVKGERHCTLPAWSNKELKTEVDAQFVISYVVAVAAHRIKIGPEWQMESTLKDPKIRKFMDKVQLEHYPRCDEVRNMELVAEGRPYISMRPARVEVAARGEIFVAEVDYAKWTPVDVEGICASDDDLTEKFRGNSQGLLPTDRIERLIEVALELENLDDVGKLTELASGHPS